MTSLGTLWRTLKFLRPEQIVGRIWFKLRQPTVDARPAPSVRARTGEWMSSARRLPTMIGASSFRFLNESHELIKIGWDNPDVAKLWRYNLHYFDDLNAIDSDKRTQWHVDLLSRWLRENPAPLGTGWEPYPTSLRIVNWCKWILNSRQSSDHGRLIVDSLATQARWLSMRLEWHLLGNHLWSNAKALAFAGLFFNGSEANAWLGKSLTILDEQLTEQILKDGGHFERSPMYHALALEDVLDLLNLLRTYEVSDSRLHALRVRLHQLAPRMLNWLRHMCHPDAEISFFNDTAIGIAPPLGELEGYAARLGIAVERESRSAPVHLEESGYVRLARGDAVAILDVAPVGPNYLPGHAHADTLSFELSLFGERVIVNCGTSCYGVGPRRAFERSTAAHNTVEIEGQSSSEVWSGFRVGRRARPRDLTIDGWSVACTHDGYAHLPSAPMHRRDWTLSENELVVTDSIGGSPLKAVARYLLHPAIAIRLVAPNRWVVVLNGNRHLMVLVPNGRATLVAATYSPEFGIIMRTSMLEVQLVDGMAVTRWSWGQDEHTVPN